jgi:hypothetical protein
MRRYIQRERERERARARAEDRQRETEKETERERDRERQRQSQALLSSIFGRWHTTFHPPLRGISAFLSPLVDLRVGKCAACTAPYPTYVMPCYPVR